ncbi:unnamed protein product [Tilletia controversa]|uniref:Uncharacterized protein n=3 Tax=Tilletia TaxID=13289 RepID=A0A8X7MTG5_9BASI|nr:hypothetical protein CF336_g3555 [Tilletia laevis]KAE8199827.1 hypothetical protein CF328_g3133 [Tilletia controversa]KAE8262010.1 hypothetical protein A4X03_0g2789 [Tilletia caries]KAE8204736.1 hypothetical protein CF335_g2546 [Tilletia laevis]KAE8248093.1 hypothetical protein A4X06_0g3965 [Tilletia controversa]
MAEPRERLPSGALADTAARPAIDRSVPARPAANPTSDFPARRARNHSDSATRTLAAVDPRPQQPRNRSSGPGKDGVQKQGVKSSTITREGRPTNERVNQRPIEAKTRPRASTLGTSLVRRGVLTSTTISNITKAKPRPSASTSQVATTSSSKLAPSLPKVRPNSCRDFKSITSSNSISGARSNSVASDATVEPDMAAFISPYRANRQRSNTCATTRSVYSQHSGDDDDDEYTASHGKYDDSDKQTTPGTSSPSYDQTSLPSGSERSSLSGPSKQNTIEYNVNPFGTTPIKVINDVFGPSGARRESNFNIISARLGSIGGSPELRSMSARFQEIEDMLAEGRENHTRRQDEPLSSSSSRASGMDNSRPSAEEAAHDAIKLRSVATPAVKSLVYKSEPSVEEAALDASRVRFVATTPVKRHGHKSGPSAEEAELEANKVRFVATTAAQSLGRRSGPSAEEAALDASRARSVATTAVISPGRLMGPPPPRPPRAKSRDGRKGPPCLPAPELKAKDVVSAQKPPTTDPKKDVVAAKKLLRTDHRRSGVLPRKRSSMAVIPQSPLLAEEENEEEVTLRPVSVDAGTRRLSDAKETSDGIPSVLMTREQWEAEYLPQLIVQERQKLFVENANSDAEGRDLKRHRSTPSLSRKDIEEDLLTPTKPRQMEAEVLVQCGGDQDGLSSLMKPRQTKTEVLLQCGGDPETSSSGLAQGRQAKRRSQSPIKSHRSSPTLSTVALPSPRKVRDSDETRAGRSHLDDGETKDEQLLPSPLAREVDLSTQSPFKAALAAAHAKRSVRTQPGSPEKGTGRWMNSVKTVGAFAEDPRSAPPVSNFDGLTTPSSSDSNLRSGNSDGVLGDFGRTDSVSSGTTTSTPTLDIRLHEPLTNLAISDVSTDLMQDDHSLLALYKHVDTSFDAGGKNLYRLLGGDSLEYRVLEKGAGKARPVSGILKKAEKEGGSVHARKLSDPNGDHTPHRNPVRTSLAADGSVLRSRSSRAFPLSPSIGGTPAKQRGGAAAAAASSSTPIGLGIDMSEAFSSRSQPGTPVKARLGRRLDDGANAEQAALPPLILGPKLKQKEASTTSELAVGDDSVSTISLLHSRNISGSFLLDEKLDDALLYATNIGTFSSKFLSPVKKLLQRNPDTPAITPRRSSLSKKHPPSRETMAPPPSGSITASQQPREDAMKPTESETSTEASDRTVTAASPAAPQDTFKTPGLAIRRPGSSRITGSGPRPSTGSRIPSFGTEGASTARASGLPRVVSNGSTSSGLRPPSSGGRQSLARSFSGERPAEIVKMSGDMTRARSGTMPTSGSTSSAAGPSVVVQDPRAEARGKRSTPAVDVTATPDAGARARADAVLRGRASVAVLPSPRLRTQSSSSTGSSRSISKSNSASNVMVPARMELPPLPGSSSSAASASRASSHPSRAGGGQLQPRPSLNNVPRAALPRPSLSTPSAYGSSSTGTTSSRLPMRGSSTRPSGAVRPPGPF